MAYYALVLLKPLGITRYTVCLRVEVNRVASSGTVSLYSCLLSLQAYSLVGSLACNLYTHVFCLILTFPIGTYSASGLTHLLVLLHVIYIRMCVVWYYHLLQVLI